MDNKKSFAIGLAAGILLMIISVFGYNAYNRHVRWDGRDPNRKILEIYSLLNDVSIMPLDINEMLENMYRGFLDGVGDPYTQYFDRLAHEAFRLRNEGDFVGIGVQAIMDTESGNVTIINPFRDSPAARAGILPGDQIIKVDGIDMTGRSTEDVFNRIKGPEGSPVILTILRPDEDRNFEVTIIRAQQAIPTVFHEMMPGNIGYIRLEGFNMNTKPQFREAMADLSDRGKTAIILDVRNNPGGVLYVVTYITNYFVPEGVITYVIDADGHRVDYNADADYLGLPLVVLINGRSASASELLAGAIRDTGAGVLVGEQTFGKGIVQHLYPLADGSAVKTTVAEYFPPSGTPIHMVGVPPDIEIEMEEALSRMIGHLELAEDIQLMMALHVIRAMSE
ncbi:MAG: S41 family peptidase [Defluviitaleaceae bacterium]|nr:S41 family peptidase [Defluviitaleaceae bacterium]